MILLLSLQILILVIWYAMPFVVLPLWLVFSPSVLAAVWWAIHFLATS